MILLRHIIIKSLEHWSTSTSGLFLHREQANDYDMAFSETSQSGYILPRSATLPDLTLGIDDYLAIVLGEYANYSELFWWHPIQLLDWYITLRPRLLQSQFDELAQAPLAWVLPPKQRSLLGIASHLQSIVNQFSMCTGHGVIILPFGISRSCPNES